MMKLLLSLFLAITVLLSSEGLSDGKIQGRLNILNGYATECVMHKFYTQTGWKQIEGEIGRSGIDGLYYKEKHGVIREVLVAESKWNTAKLGRSGKNKLVKQMSKEWVLRTLKKLQKYRPLPEYQQIRELIEHDQYRARLFRMLPVGEDKIQIFIYKIKNKGNASYETFIESTLKPIYLHSPGNTFEMMMVNAYNSCREEALRKYFPMLDSGAIELLKSDNYLQKEDIKSFLLN
jgi:hypothetical protein